MNYALTQLHHVGLFWFVCLLVLSGILSAFVADWSISTLTVSILDQLPSAEAQCQIRSKLPLDMIYTDIVGLTQFKKKVRHGYGKFRYTFCFWKLLLYNFIGSFCHYCSWSCCNGIILIIRIIIVFFYYKRILNISDCVGYVLWETIIIQQEKVTSIIVVLFDIYVWI